MAVAKAAGVAVRRAAFWWCVALGAAVVATMAFWPAFRGASGISQAIDSLPQPVIQAFGLQDFGSPAGFLRGNLYELLVPLLFSIAAVALVNGQTASDESAGRMELFLAQAIDRRGLFVARLVACMVALLLIIVTTIVVQVVADALLDVSIQPGYVIATAVLCGLLAALFGSVAYLVACLAARPSLVLAVGIGLLIGGYLVAALFPVAELLKPWAVISPWNWALGGNPLENPTEPWRLAALALTSLVLIVVGTAVVTRRDVTAP
ncbi:MAG TPA: hypothetical protein VH371_04315 [Candidatus Limnocylindrales bacterium]